jgi:hypothetical protein
MCSLVSQPFTCCAARIKTREPARATWRYRFNFFSAFGLYRYRRVMWLIHSSGAGKRPMKLKLLQYDLPALHGSEANAMMSSVGVSFRLSIRAVG